MVIFLEMTQQESAKERYPALDSEKSNCATLPAISSVQLSSGVASYGALGHVPPLDFQQFRVWFTLE